VLPQEKLKASCAVAVVAVALLALLYYSADELATRETISPAAATPPTDVPTGARLQVTTRTVEAGRRSSPNARKPDRGAPEFVSRYPRLVGRSVSGKVLDAITNSPIAGAVVRLCSDWGMRSDVTDAHGAFRHRVWWRPGMGPPSLEVTALGYAVGRVYLGQYRRSLCSNGSDASTSCTVTIKLVRGATVSGRVVGPAGPVSGAQVLLKPLARGIPGPIQVWTKRDGTFLAEATPGAGYEVYAYHGRYGIGTAHIARVLTGQVTVVREITLLARNVLVVRFVFKNGAPIPGLDVVVANTKAIHVRTDGAPVGIGETDASGYVQFLGLAPGTYRVEVPGQMASLKLPMLVSGKEVRQIVIPLCRVQVAVLDSMGNERPDATLSWEKIVDGNEKFYPPNVTVNRPSRERLVPCGSKWRIRATLRETPVGSRVRTLWEASCVTEVGKECPEENEVRLVLSRQKG